ncbi:SH3 and PX-domain-containing 3 [Mycena venus]|uniref:SH3 and PX-domain-containing 3 n=1 Tax=Mycena venus TaxID=2733690 RepID=A0A8H6XL91_9AGAR|nr:SH3 and PX-domain-containing 3 [Mycena venus]
MSYRAHGPRGADGTWALSTLTWRFSSSRCRYIFFPNASWGSGWNNVFQEQLLNTHLAWLSERAYVFPGYIPRDHPPFPDTLEDGTRHMLHVPMNAFVSGPTGGGPLSADPDGDDLMRRAISEEWWGVVCPASEVRVLKLYDTLNELDLNGSSDGEEMMAKWAEKLLKMEEPCVSIVAGSPFDYLCVLPSSGPTASSTSGRRTDTPQRSNTSPGPRSSPPPSPATSTPSAAARPPSPTSSRPSNPTRTPSPPSRRTTPPRGPSRASWGIHVRRGDYEGHCVNLANGGAEYNAWNQLGYPGVSTRTPHLGAGFTSAIPKGFKWPALPDHLNVPEGQSRRDAAFDHCWPTPEAIVARAHAVRADAASGAAYTPQDLRKVYISTNGDRTWVAHLVALLEADGWAVASTFDMELTLEERAVGQAVDMSVLTAAESFIGVGFSSFSSNVVQIRLGAGRDPGTIHFW